MARLGRGKIVICSILLGFLGFVSLKLYEQNFRREIQCPPHPVLSQVCEVVAEPLKGKASPLDWMDILLRSALFGLKAEDLLSKKQ